jgi:hypothetical protein
MDGWMEGWMDCVDQAMADSYEVPEMHHVSIIPSFGAVLTAS